MDLEFLTCAIDPPIRYTPNEAKKDEIASPDDRSNPHFPKIPDGYPSIGSIEVITLC
ncbi:hypothetical protein [Baaleninema sp.]|uniref:hypothetical protein n=1 Tax=Baaleninema sp. TaxID=3101197 RepID=UPI003D000A87